MGEVEKFSKISFRVASTICKIINFMLQTKLQIVIIFINSREAFLLEEYGGTNIATFSKEVVSFYSQFWLEY